MFSDKSIIDYKQRAIRYEALYNDEKERNKKLEIELYNTKNELELTKEYLEKATRLLNG